MTDRVLLDVRRGVAYVTLNRAEKCDGLDLAMLPGRVEIAPPAAEVIAGRTGLAWDSSHPLQSEAGPWSSEV